MIRPLSIFLLAGVLLPMIGCTTVSTANENQMEIIRTRAAFEMRCSEEELNFTPLADVDGYVYQYGVDGCGKRTVYVRENRISGGWYANTASVESQEDEMRRAMPLPPVDQEDYREDDRGATE